MFDIIWFRGGGGLNPWDSGGGGGMMMGGANPMALVNNIMGALMQQQNLAPVSFMFYTVDMVDFGFFP